MKTQFAAKFKALFNIKPAGSHVVLVVLTIVLAFCLGLTFLCIWQGVNYWPLTIFSFLILVAIILLWLVSHQDVDDRISSPLRVGHLQNFLSLVEAYLNPTESTH